MSPPTSGTFAVRVNGKLAEEFGTSRISVEVDQPATIQDILNEIKNLYPQSSETILEAIPFVSGRHRGTATEIQIGQEVTLLMPAAGG
tara:strand:- start:105 stop:368 length:264 start_codon:yes stop_codon:yes gene_type:complete